MGVFGGGWKSDIVKETQRQRETEGEGTEREKQAGNEVPTTSG